MSSKKILIQTIEGSEKNEFDKIIKCYLREVYGYDRIAITDGKDDTGIDIKVFDFGENKVQYQLTTQKSKTTSEKRAFENKLFEDVDKAKLNNTEYGWDKSLIFFYSYSLSNKRIRDYEREALKAGISLEIIEANRIAEEAIELPALQGEILSTRGVLNKVNSPELFGESESIAFDLISFGKSSDFKLQIVEAQLLNEVYRRGEAKIDDIVSYSVENFGQSDSVTFFTRLINRLMTDGRLIKRKTDGMIELSSDEKGNISDVNNRFQNEKQLFVLSVSDILDKYSLKHKLNDCIRLLKETYIQNYSLNLVQSVSEYATTNEGGISKEFFKIINDEVNDEVKTKIILKEIFEAVNEDKFIQKFAASKVFTEKTNINKVKKYIDLRKKIYLDTQIALHCLCYYSLPDSASRNYFYQVAKSLTKLAKEKEINFFLVDRYLWEVVGQIDAAYRLEPFTSLSVFKELGGSSNVFYNFYRNNEEDFKKYSTFKGYLDAFGVQKVRDRDGKNRIIKNHLSKIRIIVESVENQRYDIYEIKDYMEIELEKKYKEKSSFTLDNDAIVFEYLSDPDTDIHPLNPIFLSWDRTFYSVHGKYFDKHPDLHQWYLTTPGKFIDQYSLSQFDMSSEILTEELIAFLSNDIIQEASKLVDLLATIINPKDEVGLEYTNRIVEIKRDEINHTYDSNAIPRDENVASTVIEDVFFSLIRYYHRDDTYSIDQFRHLFTKGELLDNITNILQSSVKKTYEKRKLDDQVYLNFNELIRIEFEIS